MSKIEKKCEMCGEIFYIKCERNGRGKYCSRECFNKSRSSLKEKKCKLCGVKFFSIKKDKIYCSKQCCNIGRRKRIIKTCVQCTKFFEIVKSDENDIKFCSKECRSRSSKITKKCLVCNKFYEIIKSKNKRKYCSKKCASISHGIKYGFKPGKDHPNWTGQYRKCENCGNRLKNHNKKSKRCRKCFGIAITGENHPYWKGGKAKCIDCDKITSCRSNKRCAKCFQLYNKNENHNNWQGGITPINTKIRNSEEYKKLREYIFCRDDYRCALCNERGGKLNMHHIRKFSEYKQGRLDPKNLITVCKKDHYKYICGHEKDFQDYFDILILDMEILNKKDYK